MLMPPTWGVGVAEEEVGTSGMKSETTLARRCRSVSAGSAPVFAGGMGYRVQTLVRSVGERSKAHVSGAMLFATAWRTQTRAAARSLTSALEREVFSVTPASLRSDC